MLALAPGLSLLPTYAFSSNPWHSLVHPIVALPGELVAQVRAEFATQRGVAEPYAKKYLLSDGRARLKQLSEMLGMQH